MSTVPADEQLGARLSPRSVARPLRYRRLAINPHAIGRGVPCRHCALAPASPRRPAVRPCLVHPSRYSLRSIEELPKPLISALPPFSRAWTISNEDCLDDLLGAAKTEMWLRLGILRKSSAFTMRIRSAANTDFDVRNVHQPTEVLRCNAFPFEDKYGDSPAASKHRIRLLRLLRPMFRVRQGRGSGRQLRLIAPAQLRFDQPVQVIELGDHIRQRFWTP
jgi:hypothetical protein